MENIMLKKQITIGLLLCFIAFPSFSVDMYIGLRGEGAITRGYGDIGLYKFVGTFVSIDPAQLPVRTVRSMNQMLQFSGSVGVYAQVGFLSWYTLMPELTFSFNRGLSYSGNYHALSIQEQTDYVELTGEMRYGWKTLNINLVNQFTVVRPSQRASINFLIGPAMSIIMGDVKEQFNPDFGLPSEKEGASNAPQSDAYTRHFSPNNRFDIGVTAGLGTDIDFGAIGRLSFDVRSTWYFVPLMYTYPSPNKKVKVSLPISFNIGYAIKIV